MLLRAETNGSALRHEVMADRVVPFLRVTAQLPTEVAEQCAIFVICTAAHPLARHIHEIPQVVLACIILDGNFYHYPFLLFCTNAVMQF